MMAYRIGRTLCSVRVTFLCSLDNESARHCQSSCQCHTPARGELPLTHAVWAPWQPQPSISSHVCQRDAQVAVTPSCCNSCWCRRFVTPVLFAGARLGSRNADNWYAHTVTHAWPHICTASFSLIAYIASKLLAESCTRRFASYFEAVRATLGPRAAMAVVVIQQCVLVLSCAVLKLQGQCQHIGSVTNRHSTFACRHRWAVSAQHHYGARAA